MLEQLIIWPSEGDYLKRARTLRAYAEEALTPALRDQFLLAAQEWERLAKAAAISREDFR